MIQLDVTIMGNPYRLACKEGEERTLKEAVAYLDGKMCALRDSGKVKGNDRIAVMAALGVAAEFLSVKAPQGPLSDLTISRSQAENRGHAYGVGRRADPARKSVLTGQIRLTCRFIGVNFVYPAVFAIAIYSLNHLCASVAEFCSMGVSVASPTNPKLN